VSVSNRVGADDERAVVHGDRVRLEQAVGNLVDNALRHGAGDVLLAARPSADGVELHVVDAGPGLAPTSSTTPSSASRAPTEAARAAALAWAWRSSPRSPPRTAAASKAPREDERAIAVARPPARADRPA
jgi:histidine kinase/DNA gyrase B/HSP90-like ATPase